jgi:hypothetical protein
MRERVDDIVARYFPEQPSRWPQRFAFIGAIVSAVAVGVLLGAHSHGGLVAGLAIAPFGLFPLLVGGVMWLRQRAKTHEREKSILLSGSYDRVEQATIAVMMGGIEVNRARVVRVYAPRGRVIDLPVPDRDAHVAIVTLREHMSTNHARRV